MMTNAALAAGLLIPVVVIECLQPPQPPREVPAAQPGTTQPAEMKKPTSITMQEDVVFRDQLAGQERRIWESMKAGDWKVVEAMSSDRFVSVCPTGFVGKSQAIEQGKKNKLTAYTLSEWKSIKLDNDTGIIMYKAECTMTPPEGGSDRHTSYHSTLWRKDGNSWLAEMHQGTMAEDGVKEPKR